MSETDSVIDRLYTSYLLRDFVAKVVPGFLVLLSIVLSSGHDRRLLHAIQAFSFWGWFLLIGLAFSIGFLVQALGELVGWTRIYPDGSSHNRAARVNAIHRMIALSRSNQPLITQQRERYVVLKEMSANFSLSIVLAFVLVGSAHLPPPVPGLTRLLLLGFSIAAFLWYNRMQVSDQRTLEEKAVEPAAQSQRPRERKRAGA